MTALADQMLAAMEDAKRLAPWADANSWTVEDPGIEMAMSKARGNPTDCEGGPLLRRVNPHATGGPSMLLLEAVVDGERWGMHELDRARCDRCCADVPPRHTLWIPAGASMVSVRCCDACREQLDATFRLPALDWR